MGWQQLSFRLWSLLFFSLAEGELCWSGTPPWGAPARGSPSSRSRTRRVFGFWIKRYFFDKWWGKWRNEKKACRGSALVLEAAAGTGARRSTPPSSFHRWRKPRRQKIRKCYFIFLNQYFFISASPPLQPSAVPPSCRRRRRRPSQEEELLSLHRFRRDIHAQVCKKIMVGNTEKFSISRHFSTASKIGTKKSLLYVECLYNYNFLFWLLVDTPDSNL